MKWALFDGIAPEEARAVLALARRRKFSSGQVVFHEGDPGDTLHLIDRGDVAVRVTTSLGDTATLRILGPGEYFGELTVISPAPRGPTITALDPTETLSLHRDQIIQIRLDHPDVDRVLLDTVVGEVRRLSMALLDAMYVPVTRTAGATTGRVGAELPGQPAGTSRDSAHARRPGRPVRDNPADDQSTAW